MSQYPALPNNHFNRCCFNKLQICLHTYRNTEIPFPPCTQGLDGTMSTHLSASKLSTGQGVDFFSLWLVHGFTQTEMQSDPDVNTVSRVTNAPSNIMWDVKLQKNLSTGTNTVSEEHTKASTQDRKRTYVTSVSVSVYKTEMSKLKERPDQWQYRERKQKQHPHWKKKPYWCGSKVERNNNIATRKSGWLSNRAQHFNNSSVFAKFVKENCWKLNLQIKIELLFTQIKNGEGFLPRSLTLVLLLVTGSSTNIKARVLFIYWCAHNSLEFAPSASKECKMNYFICVWFLF